MTALVRSIVPIAWLAAATLAFGAPQAPDGGSATESRTYYVFSHDQQPIGEVATAVLQEGLRYQVAIDPDIAGDLTFVVSEPLTEGTLLDLFAAALAERDVALLRTEDGFRVATMQTALAERPQPEIVGAIDIRPRPGALAALQAPAPKANADAAPKRRSSTGLIALVVVVGMALVLAGFGWRRRTYLRRRWTIWRSSAGPAFKMTGRREAVVDAVLAMQVVPLPALAAACDRAAAIGRPVEQVLCHQGEIDEGVIARAYAAVCELPLWDVTERPAIAAPTSVPGFGDALRQHGAALIQIDDWSATVAIADPMDEAAFAALSGRSRRMLTLLVARRSDLGPTGSGLWAGEDSKGHGRGQTGELILQAILARKAAGASEG